MASRARRRRHAPTHRSHTDDERPPNPPKPQQQPPKTTTKKQPFVEQNHAVLALFPPSYDYIFLPVCLAGTVAAALALAGVGALYVAEGVGKPVPPLRLRVLPPHSASSASR
jgi:hypothetical protein